MIIVIQFGNVIISASKKSREAISVFRDIIPYFPTTIEWFYFVVFEGKNVGKDNILK